MTNLKRTLRHLHACKPPGTPGLTKMTYPWKLLFVHPPSSSYFMPRSQRPKQKKATPVGTAAPLHPFFGSATQPTPIGIPSKPTLETREQSNRRETCSGSTTMSSPSFRTPPFALTTVVSRATIEIRTSSSPNTVMDGLVQCESG